MAQPVQAAAGAGAGPGAAPAAQGQAYNFQMNPNFGQPNRRFKDSYDMKEELGKGGFGTVKRCVFKGADRREYAAKINNTPDKKKEQTDEADNCQKLSETILRPDGTDKRYFDEPCRNLVNLFDSIEEGTIVYNIYELAVGGDLSTELNNREFFPLADARWCIRQILEGVHHMHCRGYIHQDLKPANILVESKTRGKSLLEIGVDKPDLWPVYKVTDFGLTRKRERPPAQPQGPGFVAKDHGHGGTPGWNPPEKHPNPNAPTARVLYDTEADIYSCGVILYQLIAGYLPFQDGDPGRLARAIHHDDVEFPSPEWDGPAGSEMDQAKQLLYRGPCGPTGQDQTHGMLAKKLGHRMTFEQIIDHDFMKRGLGSHGTGTGQHVGARLMTLPPLPQSNAWEKYVANRQAKKAMLDQLFPPPAAEAMDEAQA